MTSDSEELVTILMPAFNAEAFLQQSVGSILNQSFSNFELIIIDDGSTDNTYDVAMDLAAKDQRIKALQKDNAGWPAARNYGLARSKGSLIALLDADDTWHPTFLERMYSALRANSDYGISYCGWQHLGVSEGRGKPYIPEEFETPDKVAKLLRGCPWPIHATLVRRYLIENAGGFNESLSSTADYDLWLKIAINTKLIRVPEVLAFYHHHDSGQITDNRARIAINQHKIQRAFLYSRPDIQKLVGVRQAKGIISKRLLYQGFDCYWTHDLPAARKIFLHAMRYGYGSPMQWIYMLPSLLPLPIHVGILSLFGNRKIKTSPR